jgi:very-short-patch-repair endonuclease
MVEGRERSEPIGERMRTSTNKVVKRSKSLRQTMTLPEVLLWNILRGRRSGARFRHQHAAGPYVMDFYCPEAALCVEVDGKAHDMGTNPARDEARDAWLAEQGIKTLRIPAEEILRDMEPVVALIREECAARSPSTGYAGPPPLENEGRNGAAP